MPPYPERGVCRLDSTRRAVDGHELPTQRANDLLAQAEYGIRRTRDQQRLDIWIGASLYLGQLTGVLQRIGCISAQRDHRVELWRVVPGFGWMTDDSPLADTTRLAKSIDGSDLGPLLSALTPGAPELPEAQRTAMNGAIFAANDPAAIAAVVRGFGDIDNHTAASLGANQIPTLAMVGDQDALVRHVRAMAGVMSNLEAVELAGANHMTAQGDPRFLEKLLGFLGEHGGN